ncbi:MAG TPA: response regulator transcription factor [Solirubrobacteraceae bacterium]|nr:response regulator transcription factor [Solirubrobacteraceae bacterium]
MSTPPGRVASPTGKVLVVDDEEAVRLVVTTLLLRAGMHPLEAPDGGSALRLIYRERPDVVILDVDMPGISGWEVLERTRQLSDTPVIMLSALGSELEKVRGLESGADDYVAKPFGTQELLARVRTQLRRAPAEQWSSAVAVIEDGLVRVDLERALATVAGVELALTRREFDLLSAFVRSPGKVLSHEALLEQVWRHSFAPSRDQVKLYVGYLRRKLRAATASDPIETVRGFGYRYRPPEQPAMPPPGVEPGSTA